MGIDLDLALLVTWQKRQISHTSMENSQRKHLALVSAMVTELEHAQQVYESIEHKLNTYPDLLDALREMLGALRAAGRRGLTVPLENRIIDIAQAAIEKAEKGVE